jgi:ATP-dependent helicase/nuclease subunit B
MAGSVISDIEREMLSQLGFELSPTRRQAAFIGQYYMYMNLTKPSEKLYISYSSLDESAKKINPSYLIGWILGIFPQLEIIKYQDIYRNDGLDMLFQGISNRKIIPLDSEWNEVLKWNLTKYENKEIVEKMLDTVFDENCDVNISLDVAKELYNEKQYSLSRFEKYASCAYAHFLQYGIGIKERDEYEIKIPDIGSILHTTMEGYAMTLEEMQLSWDSVTKEESDKIMSKCIEHTVQDYENGILFSNPRNKYKVKQIERIAKRCASVLTDHAKYSDFSPSGFEVRFDDTIGENKDKKIRGIVDRVDLFQDEEGNKLVKVIDYKSGNKHFDTALFKQGISMQLIVYMGAMLDSVKKSVPAGVFYFRFNDPIVEGDDLVKFDTEKNKNIYDDDKIEVSIENEMKMQGLVNSDSNIINAVERGAGYNEKGKLKAGTFNVKTDLKGGKDISGEGVLSTDEFISLVDFSKDKMNQFNKEIDQGIIHRNPYKYAGGYACEYCEFASVCRIEASNESEYCRYVESMKLEDFIKEITDDKDSEVE